MARISFQGFVDPVRRPRYIIWTLVAVLIIAAVMVPVLGITSTRWFCSEGCHKVQDDTITAYQHSPHSAISCMACHMPVNANPIIFLMHKAEALGELAQTVTNSYELPLNAESEVSLTMKEGQCTQCHNLATRPVTPSPGIKIDHEAHSKNEVACPICHNRTAHTEDFVPTLKDPKTGEKNRKHEDFMMMTACFRCHSQVAGSEVPTGACDACHPVGFELKPKSHNDPGFYPQGHAKLASAEESRVIKAKGEAFLSENSTDQAKASERQNANKDTAGTELKPVAEINECSTCHTKEFCTGCHGLPMPHPATFEKEHAAIGKATPEVCVKCHGNATTFCNECHHGAAMNVAYDPTVPWLKRHPTVVGAVGASACFKCHNPTYCAACHVRGVQAIAP